MTFLADVLIAIGVALELLACVGVLAMNGVSRSPATWARGMLT